MASVSTSRQFLQKIFREAAIDNLGQAQLQGPITFKIFIDLLTAILPSLNIRTGSRRERRRRTVAKQLAIWGNPKRPATNASEWLPYGRQRHSQRLDVPRRCKSRWNRHVTCGPMAILPQADSDGGLVLAMAVGPKERLAPSC